MMITLNKYGNRENRVWLELYGLSTDEKPIEKFDDIFIGKRRLLYRREIALQPHHRKHGRLNAKQYEVVKDQGVLPFD